MEVLKLGSLFAIIMVVLAFKKPLNVAIFCGLVCAIIFFRIPIDTAVVIMGKSIVSDSTILVVLSLYSITLLQRMLHHRLRIKMHRSR